MSRTTALLLFLLTFPAEAAVNVLGWFGVRGLT